MGLQRDLERYRNVGEDNRDDLTEFITQGDLAPSGQNQIRIPIKIIDLPEFIYDQRDAGGVGQAPDEPDVGDPVEIDDDAGDGDEDGDNGDEAGDGAGEHGYYEMDPEEFAEQLDEELGLDLDPKGRRVVDETEGDYTDVARRGPDSTLRVDELFRRGLKRKLAFSFDEDYARELLCVAGIGPRRAFEYLRNESAPVSYDWLEREYEQLSDEQRTKWADLDAFENAVEQQSVGQQIRRDGLDHLPFRHDDQRYRHPEIIETQQRNVVVVNIRDVSGSMGEHKREYVERTMTPMDWYLQGKYDNAEFVYIAHDTEAWTVEREDFFGIKSGGGTRVSSAYELARDILEEEYPWSEWNRYVFAAGDGENQSSDSRNITIPIMQDIDANKHAYIQVQPEESSRRRRWTSTHGFAVRAELKDNPSVVVEQLTTQDDITDAITEILGAPENEDV